MRRTIGLTLLVLLTLTTACKTTSRSNEPKLTSEQRLLIGVWQDEGRAVTTIEEQAKALVVVSVVDSDGEVFEVQHFGWDEDVFTWTYLVPSTGYVVTTDVVGIERDELQTQWRNDHAMSGKEMYYRISR